MNTFLDIDTRNAVLTTMALLIKEEAQNILSTNKTDMGNYSGDDLAMSDRLKVDQAKIDGMVLALEQLATADDPIGIERFQFTHDNGMHISNKTAPFGTILIIYESRPDVTIEAAGIAVKSGNHILLTGGKECLQSNLHRW